MGHEAMVGAMSDPDQPERAGAHRISGWGARLPQRAGLSCEARCRMAPWTRRGPAVSWTPISDSPLGRPSATAHPNLSDKITVAQLRLAGQPEDRCGRVEPQSGSTIGCAPRLPSDMPPWRMAYSWFRRWLDLKLLNRLPCDVICLRHHAAGRRRTPRLAIVDTRSVGRLPIRGFPGCDAGKKALGHKCVALVNAEDDWPIVVVVPASIQERDPLDAGKAEWPSPCEVILDDAFAARRCQEWVNLRGVRCRVLARGMGGKGSPCLRAGG